MEIGQSTNQNSGVSSPLKPLLIILGLVIILAAGYFFWLRYGSSASTNSSTTNNATSTTTPKATTAKTDNNTATSTADAWKSYTNADYNFSLTFGDLWKGYEVKKVVPTDGTALAYYYFNMPTTDTDYSAATTSTSAKFANIFAISVYTPAQWTALQADGGPIIDNVISSNTNSSYVITYAHGQAYPPTLSANASDISTVIATYKTN